MLPAQRQPAVVLTQAGGRDARRLRAQLCGAVMQLRPTMLLQERRCYPAALPLRLLSAMAVATVGGAHCMFALRVAAVAPPQQLRSRAGLLPVQRLLHPVPVALVACVPRTSFEHWWRRRPQRIPTTMQRVSGVTPLVAALPPAAPLQLLLVQHNLPAPAMPFAAVEPCRQLAAPCRHERRLKPRHMPKQQKWSESSSA